MNKLKLIIVIFAFCSRPEADAQRIWAAEMDKDVFDQIMALHVKVFRTEGTKDSVLIDWGDGNQEYLLNPYKEQYASGIFRETYFTFHQYENPGIYELRFIDSFLVDGVVNIQDSGTKRIELVDSVNVLHPDNPLSTNQSPMFSGFPGKHAEFEDGVLSIPNYVHESPFTTPEKYDVELAPFPADGYFEPLYTDSLYVVSSVIQWKRPVIPGIHALCLRIREFKVSHENPNDSIFMSTTHRAMLIEVDSFMTVSTLHPDSETNRIALFPNPATTYLHLQLTGFPHPATLEILDLTGRPVYQERLPAGVGVHDITVADWPPGVYLVRLESSGRRLVRKVVISPR